MKKSAGLFLFLVLCWISAGAQSPRVYAGINAGNVSNPGRGLETHTRIGYQIGADLQIGKRIYLQPGVQYSVTHIGLSHPSFTDSKSDLWVSGIKVPIMAGFKWNVAPSINWRFFAGPSFMAVMGVRHQHMSDHLFLLTGENYHDVEWAAHLGTGFDWKRFFIDLGFQKGLTYVFTGGSKAKSNLGYVNIGIRF